MSKTFDAFKVRQELESQTRRALLLHGKAMNDAKTNASSADPSTRTSLPPTLGRLSASQVATFDPTVGGCKRRWWLTKTPNGPRRVEPDGASTARGRADHSKMELYVLTGDEKVLPPSGRAAIVDGLLPPVAGDDAVLVLPEIPFEGDDLIVAGIRFTGFVDVFDLRALLPFATTELAVVDWKTTGSLDWARAPGDVAKHPQMVVYAELLRRLVAAGPAAFAAFLRRAAAAAARTVIEAKDDDDAVELAMLRERRFSEAAEIVASLSLGGAFNDAWTERGDADVVEATHVYLSTKKPAAVKRSLPVVAAAHAPRLRALEATVEDMKVVYEAKRVEDVPWNLAACGLYGGCPHARPDVCPRPVAALVAGRQQQIDRRGRPSGFAEKGAYGEKTTFRGNEAEAQRGTRVGSEQQSQTLGTNRAVQREEPRLAQTVERGLSLLAPSEYSTGKRGESALVPGEHATRERESCDVEQEKSRESDSQPAGFASQSKDHHDSRVRSDAQETERALRRLSERAQEYERFLRRPLSHDESLSRNPVFELQLSLGTRERQHRDSTVRDQVPQTLSKQRSQVMSLLEKMRARKAAETAGAGAGAATTAMVSEKKVETKSAESAKPTEAEVTKARADLAAEEAAAKAGDPRAVVPPDAPKPSAVADVVTGDGVPASKDGSCEAIQRKLEIDEVADRSAKCLGCGAEVKVKPQKLGDGNYHALLKAHATVEKIKIMTGRPSDVAEKKAGEPAVKGASSAWLSCLKCSKGFSDNMTACPDCGGKLLTGQEVEVARKAVDEQQLQEAAGKAEKAMKALLPSIDTLRGGFDLYLDCVPDGVTTKRLDDYVAGLCREVEKVMGVTDVRVAGKDSPLAYGGWRGWLASVARESPPPAGAYAVSSSSELALVVFEALAPSASRVVRGAK